jgi:transmembrane 9 superfamily protein 2/4
VRVPKTCEVACVKKLHQREKELFVKAIDGEIFLYYAFLFLDYLYYVEDYRVHLIIDNLPVGMFEVDATKNSVFSRGFPVGFRSGVGKGANVKHHLYNHVRIIIQYNNDGNAGDESKIVGFRVEPMSIHHTFTGSEFLAGQTILDTCNAMKSPKQESNNYQSVDKVDEVVVFTYDVFWERSTIEWSRRWDMYLTANASNDKVHWFSITNSIMIVLFLSSMIAMILIRALRKDIAKYNDPVSIEEAKEESGWKLVHGDIFRAPVTMPMLFSVLVGSGVQLCMMCLFTLSFSLVGLLSPANRGSLITAFILLFVFMGAFAGYTSAVTYKMFRGIDWKMCTFGAAFFYPGVIFSIFFTLNLMLWYAGSSGALPFTSFFTLLFLWFCVSVPLVVLGSFFGFKKEARTFPVRTNQIPRAIPLQAWYRSAVITTLLGGILPFAAVSVELYYIMSALWLHQIYYIFGFLFLVMIVLVVTCAEIAILLCYFQLCNEDYHWWWRSFLATGSCAGYMLLYAVWYNLTELDMIGAVPNILYFGYMSIISITFFLITGTIGYYSCFWFNLQIYGSIKVD